MSEQGHVKIGREFFGKVKLDYADWRWALVREFLQNCFDAPGSKHVGVTILPAEGENTLLTVENDGAPMDRETLVGKLLTLGGSGKNFDGENCGGFGVAKSLLYYCHLRYRIHTGSLLVEGSGAQYSISDAPQFWGTRSDVWIEGNETEALDEKVRRFSDFAQWKGKLLLHGNQRECDLKKGSRRKDLGWGVVYTNKQATNLCVVRLSGQPMFTRFCRFKGCVVVELTGKAKDCLTSNRDDLRGNLSSQLSDFLTDLAVDKRSALREQRAEYKRWKGDKLKHEAEQPRAVEGIAALVNISDLMRSIGETPPDAPIGGAAIQVPAGGIKLIVTSKENATATVSLGSEFIIKNTTGKKTPVRYQPGDSFSDYSKRLVKAWTGLLLKLHQLLNRSGEFSVGFVLDEENDAEHEQGIYGRVYYVNPAKLVDGKLENRWVSAWRNRHDLIATAAHEIVHGAYGLQQHDEDYAGVLTEVMAVALRHSAELEALCKPPIEAATAPMVKRV